MVSTLEFFCESKKPREQVEVKGLLAQLLQLCTIFMLWLFEKLLLLTNSLSTYCQSRDATMSTACSLVQCTVSAVNGWRSDDTFNQLYTDVEEACVHYGIEPAHCNANAAGTQRVAASGQRRKRAVAQSSMLSDSSVDLTTLGRRTETESAAARCLPVTSDRDVCRRHMFDVLDCVEMELNETQPVLWSCDTVNPNSPAFMNFNVMKPLAEAYAYLGIDCDKLKCQSLVAKTCFKLS